MSKTLEQKIRSERTVTYTIMLYIAGYAIKLAILFAALLEDSIPYAIVRYVGSTLMGLTIARILLIVSIHISDKHTKKIIACCDGIVWLLILDIQQCDSWYTAITLLFLAAFIAYASYYMFEAFNKNNDTDQDSGIYRCEYDGCNRFFDTVAARNGHMAQCKHKPKTEEES